MGNTWTALLLITKLEKALRWFFTGGTVYRGKALLFIEFLSVYRINSAVYNGVYTVSIHRCTCRLRRYLLLFCTVPATVTEGSIGALIIAKGSQPPRWAHHTYKLL